MDNRIYDVVIIGGGPAGFTAALYSARAMLETVLFEKMFLGGQMATAGMMENYPGFDEPVGGADLAEKMEKQARKFGAEIINDEVTGLELKGRIKVIKTPGGLVRSKSVILATGAVPRELGLKNEKEFKGAGVSYCATCDGAFFRNKVVAVAGGGDTAVKDAIYLSRICERVFIIHRRNELRASKYLQKVLAGTRNAEIIWDSVVEELTGSFGVEGIRIKNVKTGEITGMAVAGIFIAVGNLPDTGLIKGQVKLDENGYIITDEDMQTGIPGVFAAGDVRRKTLRQVITAAADGATAAYMAESYVGGYDA